MVNPPREKRPEQRWKLDGTLHQFRIGRSRITLRLENEAARLNPNLASPALLEALLRVVGSNPEGSAALASAITEWVGRPSRSPNAEETVQAAAYRAAGLDYRPPRSPAESIGELARVRGMTPELFAALRPHLTLFGPANPDPAAADPEVAAALTLADQLAPGTGVARPGTSDPLTVRIQAHPNEVDQA